MEDFIKVKITKLACKVTVKWLRPKKIFGNCQKKGMPLVKHPFKRFRIYQDFTLYLICELKLYYKDAGYEL